MKCPFETIRQLEDAVLAGKPEAIQFIDAIKSPQLKHILADKYGIPFTAGQVISKDYGHGYNTVGIITGAVNPTPIDKINKIKQLLCYSTNNVDTPIVMDTKLAVKILEYSTEHSSDIAYTYHADSIARRNKQIHIVTITPHLDIHDYVKELLSTGSVPKALREGIYFRRRRVTEVSIDTKPLQVINPEEYAFDEMSSLHDWFLSFVVYDWERNINVQNILERVEKDKSLAFVVPLFARLKNLSNSEIRRGGGYYSYTFICERYAHTPLRESLAKLLKDIVITWSEDIKAARKLTYKLDWAYDIEKIINCLLDCYEEKEKFIKINDTSESNNG